MKIISIESSGKLCGAALGIDGKIAAEYSYFESNKHDKLLAEFIRRLLDDTGNKTRDICAVAVSSGPGSFTGLRIGAAIAKGLCFGGSPKLIAVPTLEALLQDARPEAEQYYASEILAVIPSHRDLVYIRQYEIKAGKTGEIEVITIDEMQDKITPQTFVTGPGAELAKCGILSGNKYPTAGMILKAAFAKFENKEFTNPDTFEPMYVQGFVPRVFKV